MTTKRLDFSKLKDTVEPKSVAQESKIDPESKEDEEVEVFGEQSRDIMRKLSQYRMPFGKYKNYRLVDLPEPYVIWFSQKGFPSGELGMMLGIVYEIKVNGLEYLFRGKS